MRMIHIDFETRSELNVKDVGPVEYARHSSTQILCAAYAVDDGPVKSTTYIYDLRDLPKDAVFAAHNAAFERAIWNYLITPQYGFAPIPIHRWRCSMARAAQLGLPQSLEQLAVALGLLNRKDIEGGKLMKVMSTPNAQQDLFVNESQLNRLTEYCKQDVEVEREAFEVMGELQELDVWFLDQKINERGLMIDRVLCQNAIDILEKEIIARGKRLGDITAGVVTAPTQVAKIIQWLNSCGVYTTSLAIDQVDKLLLSKNLPADAKAVLQIRQLSAKASTAKFRPMLDRSVSDGRMRDNLRYHGAFTGRWSGTGAQIQNFPRGSEPCIETLADAFVEGDQSKIELLFGDVIEAGKNVLRAAITAPGGRRLLVWDFGQIEARVLAWVAGEKWKLNAFEQLDQGFGDDLYKLAYSKSFGVSVGQVTKAQRQVGKVMELALGYQGGVAAFNSMAAIYGVELDLKEVERAKDSWRKAHPKTVRFWYGIQDAALGATEQGEASFRGIKFYVLDNFLHCELPSGRPIVYYRPKVVEGNFGKQLTYQKTANGRLVKESTYGGKLTENVVSAIARDVLVCGMLKLDYSDFDICASVHDEVVAECDEAMADTELKRGAAIMEQIPNWAEGLPLTVDGFISKRYRK